MAGTKELCSWTPVSSSTLIWLHFQLSAPPSSWPSLIFILLSCGSARPAATNLPAHLCVHQYVEWRTMQAGVKGNQRTNIDLEGKKKKKKKNVFKAVLLQLLVTPVFISRHTQPLHQCSLRLTVSLFAASPPPSMTSSREKRTRLRVAVGDKEWKSTNKYQKLCEVAQQKTLAAPLPHTAFTQSHCIINDQNVISSCAVTGLCPHLPPPPPIKLLWI